VLGLLARRVPELSLVVTARPREEGTGSDVVEQFFGQLPHPPRRIELAGMSPDDLTLVVADPELAAVVWKGTDGNPFAVGELLRVLSDQDMLQRRRDGRWTPSHPDALAAAREALELGERRRLLERIGGLPAGRRRILEVMALLRREAPISLLGAAVKVESAELLDDLEALSSAELVILGNHGWRLSHDLVAEAIAADLGVSRKGRIHAALAQALTTGDADPAEVARHLVGAGDPAAAAAQFAAAAKRRLDRFATEEAETMADEGLDNEPAGDVLAELLETRAEARFRRGALEEARSDLRAAIQARKEGPKRALTLSRLAMLTSGAKDYVHASQLIELALAEAGDDPEARAVALAHAANFDLNLGLYERAEDRHTEAMALFQRAGLAGGMAGILESRAFAEFVRGDFVVAERLLDRVADLLEDSGELLRVANPRCARGLTLAWMNRPEEGLADIEDALELARLVGNIELEGHVLLFRSQVLGALGKLEESYADAEETLAISGRMGHRELKVSGLIGLGSALHLMGRLPEAEDRLREAVNLAGGIRIFKDAAAVRLAPVLIDRGKLDEAEEHLRNVLQGPPMSHCEARLWLAVLAHKRRSPDAIAFTEEALALARDAGHLASAVKLEELLRAGSDYNQGLAESSS
jgi:tetratricopeptide (TPR) repeat protein